MSGESPPDVTWVGLLIAALPMFGPTTSPAFTSEKSSCMLSVLATSTPNPCRVACATAACAGV